MFNKPKPVLHNMPLADYIEHEPDPECVCGPILAEDANMKFYEHPSLDGREKRQKHG